MSRVFVVQQPAYWDGEARRFVPKYDLSPASKFGRLHYLLGPGNIFADRLDQARDQMDKILANYTPDDYILPVGDPVAIALACMIAGRNTMGRVNVLKFSRLKNEYQAFPIAV